MSIKTKAAAQKKLDHVLTWVNRTRTKHGLKPLKRLPKGYLVDPTSCVIAKAIKGRARIADGVVNSANGKGEYIKFPKFIRQFITDFDNEQYPNLIAKYKG